VFRSTAFFRNSILLAFALSACVTAYAQRGQQRPRIVLEALDLDHDGGLLAIEIQAAPSSLRALDKDGDGEISMEEMTPRRQDAGADPELLVKQLMQFDKNGDGYLTQDELPERMQGLLLAPMRIMMASWLRMRFVRVPRRAQGRVGVGRILRSRSA
jgi:hypothetical protein